MKKIFVCLLICVLFVMSSCGKMGKEYEAFLKETDELYDALSTETDELYKVFSVGEKTYGGDSQGIDYTGSLTRFNDEKKQGMKIHFSFHGKQYEAVYDNTSIGDVFKDSLDNFNVTSGFSVPGDYNKIQLFSEDYEQNSSEIIDLTKINHFSFCSISASNDENVGMEKINITGNSTDVEIVEEIKEKFANDFDFGCFDEWTSDFPYPGEEKDTWEGHCFITFNKKYNGLVVESLRFGLESNGTVNFIGSDLTPGSEKAQKLREITFDKKEVEKVVERKLSERTKKYSIVNKKLVMYKGTPYALYVLEGVGGNIYVKLSFDSSEIQGIEEYKPETY